MMLMLAPRAWIPYVRTTMLGKLTEGGVRMLLLTLVLLASDLARWDARGWTDVVLGGLVVAFGGATWAGVRHFRRRDLLLRRGTAWRGEICERRVRNSWTGVAADVSYAFVDSKGTERTRTVSFQTFSGDLPITLVAGSSVTVFQDPLDPERHEPDVFGVGRT